MQILGQFSVQINAVVTGSSPVSPTNKITKRQERNRLFCFSIEQQPLLQLFREKQVPRAGQYLIPSVISWGRGSTLTFLAAGFTIRLRGPGFFPGKLICHKPGQEHQHQRRDEQG